jgi:excisionase family DNA binding protein
MSDWLTTAEAVKLSGYHAYYLRELIRGGKIKAQKFGPLWQVDSASLKAYIRASEKSDDKRRGAKRQK